MYVCPTNRSPMKNSFVFIFLIFITLLAVVSCKKDEKPYVPAGQPCEGLDKFYFINRTYHTVQLGNQCWMRDNLDYGKITEFSHGQRNNDTVERYCYDNDVNNCIKYGSLYTWPEMMKYDTIHEGIQGICPDGWHIPTDMEYYDMEHFIDSTINETTAYGERGTDAGVQLRYAGKSGFEALMGGFMNVDGSFYGIESGTNFWTSSRSNDFTAWSRYLSKSGWTSGRYHSARQMAFSVRCIKND